MSTSSEHKELSEQEQAERDFPNDAKSALAEWMPAEEQFKGRSAFSQKTARLQVVLPPDEHDRTLEDHARRHPYAFIVVATDAELDAVGRFVHLTRAATLGQEIVYEGTLGLAHPVNDHDSHTQIDNVRVAVFKLGQQGGIGALSAGSVGRVVGLFHYKPVLFLMVGIAWGRSTLGLHRNDVLVATKVLSYQSVKVGPNQHVENRNVIQALHTDVAAQLQTFINEQPWLLFVRDPDVAAGQPKHVRPAAFHAMAMLSGDVLVDSWQEQLRQLAVVGAVDVNGNDVRISNSVVGGGEMEGTALASQLEGLDCNIPFVMAKAVSDYGMDKDCPTAAAAADEGEPEPGAIPGPRGPLGQLGPRGQLGQLLANRARAQRAEQQAERKLLHQRQAAYVSMHWARAFLTSTVKNKAFANLRGPLPALGLASLPFTVDDLYSAAMQIWIHEGHGGHVHTDGDEADGFIDVLGRTLIYHMSQSTVSTGSEGLQPRYQAIVVDKAANVRCVSHPQASEKAAFEEALQFCAEKVVNPLPLAHRFFVG